MFFKDVADTNIFPAYKNSNIPILISSSDYYIPYASVLVQSILSSSSEKNNYDIILLHNGLDKKNKIKLLKTIKNCPNFSLRFYNIAGYIDGYNLSGNHYISIETYFRLLAPELLVEYEKIIYLDVDTVVCDDLYNLYKTNIGDCYLGAVVDIHTIAMVGGYDGIHRNFRNYLEKELEIKTPFSYFQAGVLILNLKTMRSKFSFDQSVKLLNSKQFIHLDQDVLNMQCIDNYYQLDMEWNVFPDWVDGGYKQFFAPLKNYLEYQKALASPKIIHFAGLGKPWDNPDDSFADYFWKYARYSPFYGIILRRLVKRIIKIMSRKVVLFFFPLQSARGEFIRKIYHKLQKNRYMFVG